MLRLEVVKYVMCYFGLEWRVNSKILKLLIIVVKKFELDLLQDTTTETVISVTKNMALLT